jgi:hypothetical protein
MPLRTLGKAKFLQTYGRAARLDIEDRDRITKGEITPDQLGDMNKPYAWVIVPTIIHGDDDNKENIKNLIAELRDYNFKPSEDIVTTKSGNGIATINGPDALNEIKKKCPNIGQIIENVEADYEEERLARLYKENKILFLKEKGY